jgi:hypothetical protein
MAEYTAWAIGGVAGGIALLAILLHIRRHKRLHNEWIREMNAQAEHPFVNTTPPKDSPDSELLTRS